MHTVGKFDPGATLEIEDFLSSTVYSVTFVTVAYFALISAMLTPVITHDVTSTVGVIVEVKPRHPIGAMKGGCVCVSTLLGAFE